MNPQISPLLLNSTAALAAMLLMIYIVKALTVMLKTVKDKGPAMDYKFGHTCISAPAMALHFEHTDRTLEASEKTRLEFSAFKANLETLAKNSEEQTTLLRQLVEMRREFVKR